MQKQDYLWAISITAATTGVVGLLVGLALPADNALARHAILACLIGAAAGAVLALTTLTLMTGLAVVMMDGKRIIAALRRLTHRPHNRAPRVNTRKHPL